MRINNTTTPCCIAARTSELQTDESGCCAHKSETGKCAPTRTRGGRFPHERRNGKRWSIDESSSASAASPAHSAGLRNCTVGRPARRDHKKQKSPARKCAITHKKEATPKLFAAPKLSTATKMHDLLSRSSSFMFFCSAYRKHSLSNKVYRAIFSHLFSIFKAFWTA